MFRPAGTQRIEGTALLETGTVTSARRAGILSLILSFVPAGITARAAPKAQTDGTLTRDHVRLEFHGTPQPYAEALATIAESNWRLYSQGFALDLPDELSLSVDIRRSNRVAIYHDGDSRITLTLHRTSQLQPPAKSKVFNIYGLCYEMADLALHRTIGEPPWLTDAAVRGLSHFCASRAIDRLYAHYGRSLWPDRYAYDDEGTRRLKKQVKRRRATDVIKAAGLWQEFARIVDDKALGAMLNAWRITDVGPQQPAVALRKAVPSARDSYHQSKLNHWFDEFKKIAIRPESSRGRRSGGTVKLSRKPIVLKYDDGTSEGKQCLPQDGHIVFFQSPPDHWYVTTLDLYGQRFGPPLRKMEYATITLCDKALHPITAWQKPYGFFRGARPRWFHIRLPPTRVPREFAIAVQFFCLDDKGVQVHRDDSVSGHSAIGQPGGLAKPLAKGDWMIRAELDTAKTSNPLIWQP